MLVHPVVKNPYSSRRKIRGTAVTVWVEEKQAISHGRASVACQCPIRNIIMYLFGLHVINILRIVYASYRGFHASKLARLLNDIAHIAALADPVEFAIGHCGAVHDNGRYRPHPIFTLSAGLAFD